MMKRFDGANKLLEIRYFIRTFLSIFIIFRRFYNHCLWAGDRALRRPEARSLCRWLVMCVLHFWIAWKILFSITKIFLIRCKFSNEILLKLKSEMPPFNCSNWCWQQHGPHRPASIDLAVNPIRCNKLTKNWCPSNNRALVGGGAGGAIAPPTFLDLLNRYQFLPKNSNFF